MYIFANFKVFLGIMLLVNFTLLQFSQCFFYKLAVFHDCQKHLDDKTQQNIWKSINIKLQIVKKFFWIAAQDYHQIPPAAVASQIAEKPRIPPADK